MSKIRNSLGVLVLPVPYEKLSWEEYKAKYGIDLATVFPLKRKNGHVGIAIERLDKILYISDKGLAYTSQVLNPVLSISVARIEDDNPRARYSIPIIDWSVDRETFVCNSMLDLMVYDNPESEPTIEISEL